MYKLIPLITTQRIAQVKALRDMHPKLSLKDAVAIVDRNGTLYQDSGIDYDGQYFALEYVGPYVTDLDQAVSAKPNDAQTSDQRLIIQRLRGIIERMFSEWGTGTDVRELHKLSVEVAHAYSAIVPIKKTTYSF